MNTLFNRNFLKKVSVVFAAVVFSSVVFAQEAVAEEENKEQAAQEDVIVLTVQDAVDYSNKNSLTLKSSEIDLELAKWKKNVAWNTFLPTAQVRGTMARANDIKPSPEDESLHWTAMGDLSLSFNFNVAMIYNMSATIASYESGKLTWEEAVKSNELNVKKLFYALLLQQESLNLQKASLENARQRMNQAATNYRNGYIPHISYLQTQVAYENQVPTVEKAEAAMRQSLDTFTFIIGMPIGTKVRLEGEINPEYVDVDVDSLVEKSLENNLSVKSLKQSIKTLKMQSTALGLSTYTPSLALSWNGNPVITNALKNDWGEKDNWKDNGALSFSLVWNITNMLPWSSNGTTAKELSANIDKLETNLEVLRRNTELEIRTAVDSLNQSKKAIESSQRNITLAQKSYDMTWQAYINGTTEYLNLKEAETQLNQAKLGLANEKYNYMTNRMDLENKVNTTLSGDK